MRSSHAMNEIKLISLLLLIIFFSCADDQPLLNQRGYPDGMTRVNEISVNDCFLPICSEDRFTLFNAQGVEGTLFYNDSLNMYGATYDFTFDSYLHLYFCDLPEALKQENLEIRFSGTARKACGAVNPVLPVEEAYIIQLTSVEER